MAAKQLTKTFGEATVQSHSMTKIMTEVYRQAGGEYEKILETMGKPELARAVLMIGQNADQAKSNLDELGNSAGSATEAFENNANTMEGMMQSIRNNFNDIKETFMKDFLPTIKEVMGYIKSAVQFIGNLPAPLKTFISYMGVLTSAFLTLKYACFLSAIYMIPYD